MPVRFKPMRPSPRPNGKFPTALAAVGALLVTACPAAHAQGDVSARPMRLAAAEPIAPSPRVVVRTSTHARRSTPAPIPLTPAIIPASADRSDPAPMPNPDLFPPQPSTSLHVQASPSLFEINNGFRGDGYPYGATPQGLDDKHATFIPGVNVQVPLKQ